MSSRSLISNVDEPVDGAPSDSLLRRLVHSVGLVVRRSARSSAANGVALGDDLRPSSGVIALPSTSRIT